MNDSQIIEMLKNSQAFKEYFDAKTQEEMISKFPSLKTENKLSIVGILMKEADGYKKIYDAQMRILTQYKEDLEELLKKAGKNMTKIVEDSERAYALEQVDTQMKNL